MKTKPVLIGIAVVVALVILRFAVTTLQSDKAPVAQATQASTSTTPGDKVQAGGGWQAKTAAAQQEKKPAASTGNEGLSSEQLLEKYGFSEEKIAALRAAKDGDPRTPPIKRRTQRVLPTAEELADPELYMQYEEAQKNVILAGYVKAVEPKINRIKKHMAALEQYDFPEREKFQQIADEKIAALTEMKAKLLAENPELATIETPLLDLSSLEEESVNISAPQ